MFAHSHGGFDPRRDGRKRNNTDIIIIIIIIITSTTTIILPLLLLIVIIIIIIIIILRRAAPGGASPTSSDGEALVSVICPTSSDRQGFHPMLYECFRAQTHGRRELVVVDTGGEASAFWQARAKTTRTNKRTTNTQKHQQIHTNRSNIIIKNKFPQARAREDKRVVYRFFEVHPRAWSVGLKRNIACHLARGEVVAFFDDDDLYAPGYLSHMLAQLLPAASRPRR